MQIRFPGESAQYRAARDRLLEREIELRRAMEAVAAARRALPPQAFHQLALTLRCETPSDRRTPPPAPPRNGEGRLSVRRVAQRTVA